MLISSETGTYKDVTSSYFGMISVSPSYASL